MDMGEAFTRAYKDGQWFLGSGSGSSPNNTATYRRFLREYFARHGIRSVLDLGCGDWRVSRLINWEGIDYLGIDIVPGLVADLKVRFEGNEYCSGAKYWPGVRFECADILTMTLPPADLVLCKDLLQHWPDQAISALIGRLVNHRALITYDHHSATLLPDIEPGGYRPLDLRNYYTGARHVLRYESVSHEGQVRRAKVVTELVP